jgi:hypothetical protein
MPTSHKLFLGVSLAVILTFFVVASRPPSEADLEYRPPAPTLEDEAARRGPIEDDHDRAGERAKETAAATAPVKAGTRIKSATAARP